MEFIGYIASFFMGIVLGLTGGGGAILTVPILVYFFHYSPALATSYSLFIVGFTAAIGGFLYFQKGKVNLKMVALFALPSLAGVQLSRRWILPSLPEDLGHVGTTPITKDLVVMVAFSLLMILASFSMILKKALIIEKPSQIRWGALTVQSFFVGLAAGFVGAGGGFLIIPALVNFASLPILIAIGTSLCVVSLQSLSGFLGDILHGTPVNGWLLSTITAISVSGAFLGSRFATKFDEKKLKILFGWFVLIVGTVILLEQILRSAN